MTVMELERQWRLPIDVEWVGGTRGLCLLQVRPVADSMAQLATATPPRHSWSRRLTAERFPHRLCPLGWDALQPSLRASVDGLHSYLGVRLANPSLVATAIDGHVYASDAAFSFPRTLNLDWRRWASPSSIAAGGLNAAKALLPWIRGQAPSWWTALALLATEKVYQRLVADYQRRRAETLQALTELRNETETLQAATQVHAVDLAGLIERSLLLGPRFMASDFSIFILKEWYFWLVRRHRHPRRAWSNVEVPKSPTVTMHQEWLHLVEKLQRSGAWDAVSGRLNTIAPTRTVVAAVAQILPASLAHAWTSWWQRYRSLRWSWDIREPSWLDTPGALAKLCNALAQDPVTRDAGAAANGAEVVPSRDDMARARCRTLGEIDDEQHFIACDILSNAHDLVELAAACLVDQDVLICRDDAYFLSCDELKGALLGHLCGVGFIAERRRAQWERCGQRTPATVLGESVPTKAELAAPQGSMLGVSAGIAKGPLVFADDFGSLAKVTRGSILVTAAPKPELAPLFPVLGGLITRTGGFLAHAFVAAREVGLPAVSGLNDSVQVEVGQIVQIDGTRGTIEFLNA